MLSGSGNQFYCEKLNKYSALTGVKKGGGTWKFQLRPVVLCSNIWGYVIGAVRKPPVISGPYGAVRNAKNRELWKKQDEKARTGIVTKNDKAVDRGTLIKY